MMELELKNILINYDKKLNESLILNSRMSSEITRIKVYSFLDSMKPLKIFTLLVGIIWTLFLTYILSSMILFSPNPFELILAQPFFMISLIIYTVLHIIAISIYIYQMVILQQVDLGEPVLGIQNKISKLKYTSLWVTKILMLQLPLWTVFWWSTALFKEGDLVLIILQVLVAGMFAWAAIWLFFNIKYENRDKKWFQLIFRGKEWTPLLKSMELLNQLEELEGDEV